MISTRHESSERRHPASFTDVKRVHEDAMDSLVAAEVRNAHACAFCSVRTPAPTPTAVEEPTTCLTDVYTSRLLDK